MTVRVSNRQVFEVSANTYWRDVWLSLPFLQRLYCEILGFSAVELIEQRGDHERGMQRRLRLHKPITSPAAVQKVLGSAMILDEESTFDPRAQRWSYRMIPARLADRLDVSGSITLSVHERGVEELSEDSMTFHMFGVASLIEPFMARENRQSHAQRLAFTKRFIAEQKLNVIAKGTTR